MAKRRRLSPALFGGTETHAAAPDPAVETAPARRIPIAEVASEAAMTAAFHEVAGSLQAARDEGRLIRRIALDQIDAHHLVRDRVHFDPEELTALRESLRLRGQQTPVEVVDLGGDRWGLISGWRRLTALQSLYNETLNSSFETVLAIVRQPTDAAQSYLAMVEENEIRAGLSYYERARIVARATDAGAFSDDRAALSTLFHAASRPRRSKIGSFIRIVRALDADLRFPAAISERAGLALAAALDRDPGLADRLAAALRSTPAADPVAEAARIAGVIAPPRMPQKKVSNRPLVTKSMPRIAIGEGLDGYAPAAAQLLLAGPLLEDPAFRERLLAWLRAEI